MGFIELFADILVCDFEFLCFLGGHVKHSVHHHTLHNRAQSTGTELILHGLVDERIQCLLRKRQLHTVHLKELLVLLDKQIEKRLAKYTFLSDRLKNVYGDRDIASLTGSDRGDYLVLLGAVMREQTYLDWLKKSREAAAMWDNSSKRAEV